MRPYAPVLVLALAFLSSVAMIAVVQAARSGAVIAAPRVLEDVARLNAMACMFGVGLWLAIVRRRGGTPQWLRLAVGVVPGAVAAVAGPWIIVGVLWGWFGRVGWDPDVLIKALIGIPIQLLACCVAGLAAGSAGRWALTRVHGRRATS